MSKFKKNDDNDEDLDSSDDEIEDYTLKKDLLRHLTPLIQALFIMK